MSGKPLFGDFDGTDAQGNLIAECLKNDRYKNLPLDSGEEVEFSCGICRHEYVGSIRYVTTHLSRSSTKNLCPFCNGLACDDKECLTCWEKNCRGESVPAKKLVRVYSDPVSKTVTSDMKPRITVFNVGTDEQKVDLLFEDGKPTKMVLDLKDVECSSVLVYLVQNRD